MALTRRSLLARTALTRHLNTPNRLPYNQSQLPTVSSVVLFPSSSFSCLAFLTHSYLSCLIATCLSTHSISRPFFPLRTASGYPLVFVAFPAPGFTYQKPRSFCHYHRFVIRSEPEPLRRLHIRYSTRGSHKPVFRWLDSIRFFLPPQLSSTFPAWSRR